MATKTLKLVLEAAMSGQTIKIISDARRSASPVASNLHDETGHHRYYGCSAVNGGEPIVETRRGKQPRARNVCGF
jgi:hypothetical protein